MKNILYKLFGDRKSRLMKRMLPMIESIKERGEEYRSLEDDDFPRKTEEFVSRVNDG